MKFGKVEKNIISNFKVKDLSGISKIDTISPPSVFIGSRLKYPNVNVGIISPIGEVEDASLYEDYGRFARENFGIGDIVRLRRGLLNSRFRANVRDVLKGGKFLDLAKDVGISSKPVDLEIELGGKIGGGVRRDEVLAPHGMSVKLKNAEIVSNIKVNKFVDRVINDEIKAREGVFELSRRGISEYEISKILSVGVMGIGKEKKIVPTRYSITATDDMLGGAMLKEVKKLKQISDYELHLGEFMGNEYLILFFPDVFNFELFELYYPGSSWNPGSDFRASWDYEGFDGRKSYAESCAGGYYATRLAVLEYLKRIGRQAGVLVVRLERPTYWASLGVWVVRESVRRALGSGKSISKFEDVFEFLNSVEKISKLKFDFDFDLIGSKSWYIKKFKEQKKVDDF